MSENAQASRIPVASVVFSYYPDDPRVRREAEALCDAGFDVTVFCLRGKGQLPGETVHGVNVRRLPIERKRGSKSRYLWEYFAFIVLSAFVLSVHHFRRRFRAVHIHNMPDVLVFASVVPRLTGARIILDLHDPMPEVYMAKYNLGANHFVIRTLCWLERFSIRFSHAVITPNISFQRLFEQRGCPSGKIHIVMNSPQESIFLDLPRVPKNNATFTIMFHGTMAERSGILDALLSMKLLRGKIPGLRFITYGDGDCAERFVQAIEENAIGDVVTHFGQRSLEEIAAAIPCADIGLIANQRTVFTELNLPTRIFEYLCMGTPVIAPRTQGIGDYFAEDALFFFDAGDVSSLSRTILHTYENPRLRATMVERGQAVYAKHRWESEQLKLVELYRALGMGIHSVLSPSNPE